MNGQTTKSPVAWSVKENNIAPVEVSNPNNTGVFEVSHGSVTLESGVIIEGKLLVPVLFTPSY